MSEDYWGVWAPVCWFAVGLANYIFSGRAIVVDLKKR